MEEGHSLNIEQCKKISATAISSVDSFSQHQIVLSYSGGRIVVAGSGMKIVNFSKTSGSFAATDSLLAGFANFAGWAAANRSVGHTVRNFVC